MKQLFHEEVYFAGIDGDVNRLVVKGISCQTSIPHQKYEPVQMSALPEGSWSENKIEFDGSNATGECVVIIDGYSRFSHAEIIK